MHNKPNSNAHFPKNSLNKFTLKIYPYDLQITKTTL